MVVEFVGSALGSDATALIEGFVEDADAVEGATVVAGGYTGALYIHHPIPSAIRSGFRPSGVRPTFRLDFLQAKQAVETLFFQRLDADAEDDFPDSRGGLPSDEGEGPGASWRYCDASLISP